MRVLPLLAIMVLLLAGSAMAQQIVLDPELYFLVKDTNASASDVSLRDDLVKQIDSEFNLKTLVTNYKITSDDKIRRKHLLTASAILVYKGQVLIVRGEQLSAQASQATDKLIDFIQNELGAPVQILNAADLVSDNLFEHLVLVDSELVFVLADDATISEGVVLDAVATEALYSGVNVVPESFKKASEVNLADLSTQVTVFIDRGQALIVNGDQATPQAIQWGADVESILENQYDIHWLQVQSSQMTDTDFRSMIGPSLPSIALPDLLFVVDDQSPASDLSLTVAVQQAVAKFSPIPVQTATGSSRLNSQVTQADLEGRVTVFVYQGQPAIIVGASSPAYQSLVASALSKAFYEEKGLDAEQLVSSDVTSDDLRTTVVAPVSPPTGVRNPELLFVTEQGASFADQGLLTMFADVLDEELDLNNSVNNYAFKTEGEVTPIDDPYDFRVTVFAYKGELLIITGSHSPLYHEALADQIAEIAMNELGIEAQRIHSSSAYPPLRWSVDTQRMRFNSLYYSLDVTSPIPPVSDLTFGPLSAQDNSSGRINVAVDNLSTDGAYYLRPQEDPTSEYFGQLDLAAGQISLLSYYSDADKIETWSMVNDSLQKTIVFDLISQTTFDAQGTLTLTLRIDSIADFNVSYQFDVNSQGAGVGTLYLDPTEAFPGFAAVRTLSLKGRVFKALGDLQPDGGLVAKDNVGTFVTPIINGNYFLTLFHDLTDHIFFSVSGIDAYNSTYPPAEEPPFPLEHDLTINQTQRGAYVNLFDVPRQLQYPHFLDSDLDGVPDQIDACKDTEPGDNLTTISSVLASNDPYVFNDNGTLPVINVTLASIKPVISSSEAPFLADGVLGTSIENSTYTQRINLQSGGAEPFTSTLQMIFRTNQQGEQSNFLYAQDGGVLLEYELDFASGLSSGVDSSGYLDFNNSPVKILGTDFVIAKGKIDTATSLASLRLVGGPAKVTLRPGEVTTVVIENRSYELEIFETNPAGNTMSLRINDREYVASPSGTSLMDFPYYVSFTDLRFDPVPELDLFLESISLDIDDVYSDGLSSDTVGINGQSGDNLVSIQGTLVSPTEFALSSIRIRTLVDGPDGDLYVRKGQGVRENLERPESMIAPTWDIAFAADSQIIFQLLAVDPPPPIGFYIHLQNGQFVQTTSVMTTQRAVDSFGCSCSQKNCAAEGLGCVEQFGQASCQATCSDGFQNGLETGVDCGLSCGVACGPNGCLNPSQCIGTAPGFCGPNLTIINQCTTCGCPAGQICTGLETCANTLPPHCTNGIFDGDERNVDCGGSCFAFCPGDPCDTPGLCLAAKPAFCSLPSGAVQILNSFDLRGVDATYYQVATTTDRAEVISALQRASLNFLIVDAKTEDGLLGYLSNVGPTANPNWPDGEPVKAAIAAAHAAGMTAGVRVSIGQDGSWLAANPQDQIVGNWVNLCSQAYVDYLSNVIAELAGLGADVIVMDFFRGPDFADGATAPITCSGGTPYSDVLISLADRLDQSAKTASPSVRTTLTLFGRIPNSPNDIIGQTVALGNEVDFVMPMLFKSQLFPQTLPEAIDSFVNAGISGARLKPFIQAFPPFDNAVNMIDDIQVLSNSGASGFAYFSFITVLPSDSIWDAVGTALQGQGGQAIVTLNCQQCGCPTGSSCSATGACVPPPPPPINPCLDGVQDGNERGVDCGGTCGNSCPNDQCPSPGKCLGEQPLLCTDNATIVTDCHQCGCPTHYQCGDDGLCTTNLQLWRKKCLNGDLFTLYKFPGTCNDFADSTEYRTEYAQNYIYARLIGNLPSWWGKKDARNELKKAIRSTTLCFGEYDYGCVLPDFDCPMEEYVESVKPELAGATASQVKSLIRKSIPGIVKNWPFNFHGRVHVDYTNLNVSTTFPCPLVQVTSTRVDAKGTPQSLTCDPYIQNGDPDQKIDLLFIGDGFTNDQELQDSVEQVLDYDSVRADTKLEGLFSKEPYASRKKNFNVWTMRPAMEIPYTVDERMPGSGAIPDQSLVLKNSIMCPQRDMIVLLSKKAFRSHCLLGYPGPCMVSLSGEDFPGRVLTHELGHGIGLLSDEYYERVDLTGSALGFAPENLIARALAGPNCKPDEQSAREKWGALMGSAGIGLYKSCGGVCTQSCGTFLRPTEDSIMNNQWCAPGTEVIGEDGNVKSCDDGPPFVEFNAVSAKQLSMILDQPQIVFYNSSKVRFGKRN